MIMTKRPIKIHQQVPRANATEVAIVPIGLYCNTALQKARPGDAVCFQYEWRKDNRRIVQMCRFRVNSPEFTFMLRSIYGEGMTIAKLMEQWEAWAIVEGIGKEGIDKEQCIIVEVEPINEGD